MTIHLNRHLSCVSMKWETLDFYVHVLLEGLVFCFIFTMCKFSHCYQRFCCVHFYLSALVPGLCLEICFILFHTGMTPLLLLGLFCNRIVFQLYSSNTTVFSFLTFRMALRLKKSVPVTLYNSLSFLFFIYLCTLWTAVKGVCAWARSRILLSHILEVW